MKSENLWTIPPAVAPSKSTETAVKILNEQASYLGESMNNKVKASFHTLPQDEDFFDPNYDYVLALNGTTMDNADEFYGFQRYAFDIFNASYLFRLFTLYLPPFYPFDIYVDRDVLNEAIEMFDNKMSEKIETNRSPCVKTPSDSDLKDTLKMLFSTRKVQFMLYKLRQLSEEAEKAAKKS